MAVGKGAAIVSKTKQSIDFLILTASYQRGDLLLKIIEKLTNDAHEHGLVCTHVIVDDCSPADPFYAQIEELSNEQDSYQVIYRRNQKNNGRAAFWQTMNSLWSFTKELSGKYKYVIQIADDLMPCDDFLGRASRMFDELKTQDPSICAMNTQCTLLRNWETTRYIDGAYIADERFFAALNYEMESTDITIWHDNPLRGSGTGFQITTRMMGQDAVKIAPCQDVAFCQPIVCPSVMFPKDIRPQIWWRDNYIDRGEESVMNTMIDRGDSE